MIDLVPPTDNREGHGKEYAASLLAFVRKWSGVYQEGVMRAAFDRHRILY